MHPQNMSRSAPVGEKQVNSAIIKGPTQTVNNVTPFNRRGNGKK